MENIKLEGRFTPANYINSKHSQVKIEGTKLFVKSNKNENRILLADIDPGNFSNSIFFICWEFVRGITSTRIAGDYFPVYQTYTNLYTTYGRSERHKIIKKNNHNYNYLQSYGFCKLVFEESDNEINIKCLSHPENYLTIKNLNLNKFEKMNKSSIENREIITNISNKDFLRIFSGNGNIEYLQTKISRENSKGTRFMISEYDIFSRCINVSYDFYLFLDKILKSNNPLLIDNIKFNKYLKIMFPFKKKFMTYFLCLKRKNLDRLPDLCFEEIYKIVNDSILELPLQYSIQYHNLIPKSIININILQNLLKEFEEKKFKTKPNLKRKKKLKLKNKKQRI